MQNRRKFIQQISTGALIAGMSNFPIEVFAGNEVQKLTILHSNDVHSRIDPFPADDKKFAGLGGMAQKSACIQKIRAEENQVLLLDSGDIFQGTPYFNFYHGELEMKLMSEMQYDAATLGNHDFDAGMDGFAEQLPHANFPFIVSNYDFTNTELNGKIHPYKIIEKDKIKIGIFGLGIELKGLVPDKLFGDTIYIDPILTANKMTEILKEDEKCDYIICLSHLGYQYKNDKISDIVIAQQTKDIDLILGGHTHTFLERPLTYKNIANEEVLINQVGWGGVWLGRIDIFFEKKSRKKWHSGNPVIISK